MHQHSYKGCCGRFLIRGGFSSSGNEKLLLTKLFLKDFAFTIPAGVIDIAILSSCLIVTSFSTASVSSCFCINSQSCVCLKIICCGVHKYVCGEWSVFTIS